MIKIKYQIIIIDINRSRDNALILIILKMKKSNIDSNTYDPTLSELVIPEYDEDLFYLNYFIGRRRRRNNKKRRISYKKFTN